MVVSKSVRMRVGWCALIGMAGIAAARSSAAIQYDAVTLPQGVFAYGIDHGHAVGMGLASGGAQEVAVWETPGKAPQILGGVAAYGISGNEIVGAGPNSGTHAILWQSGNPVNLGPTGSTFSTALATDGTYQGGAVGSEAALWNGTAGTFVNLNTNWPISAVTGLSDGTQVGYGGTQALLWHGTPGSQVILSPSVSSASKALAISHGQIVGSVTINNQRHAAIWTGQTAATFVDIGRTFDNSQLNATNGTQQAGYVTDMQYLIPFGQEPLDTHPAVWTGTAASAQLLPLPAGFHYGQAYGIDQDGNIAGYASTDEYAQTKVALLWVPHRLPGDANFDGKVDFTDLLTIGRNYGKTGADLGWVDGDFMDEGRVGFDDLLIVARNYGSGAPTAAQLAQFDPSFRADVERAFADVPEPSATGLVVACIGGLMGSRNRGAAGHAPSEMSDRP